MSLTFSVERLLFKVCNYCFGPSADTGLRDRQSASSPEPTAKLIQKSPLLAECRCSPDAQKTRPDQAAGNF